MIYHQGLGGSGGDLLRFYVDLGSNCIENVQFL